MLWVYCCFFFKKVCKTNTFQIPKSITVETKLIRPPMYLTGWCEDLNVLCSRNLNLQYFILFYYTENFQIPFFMLFLIICLSFKFCCSECLENCWPSCWRTNRYIMHWFVPLLHSIFWLLHVSAVACHHQGASWIRLGYLKYRSNRWYII
jgi:hypothetical protein